MINIVKLPKITDPRGNLSFIQSGPGGACPFEIGMVKWWFDLSSHDDTEVQVNSPSRAMLMDMSGSFNLKGQIFRTPDRAALISEPQELNLSGFATNTVVMMLTEGEASAVAEGAVTDPHPKSAIDNCRIVTLPRITLPGGGSFTFVDNEDSPLPFKVRRVFYLYDVPADAMRGGHSHFQAEELIIAMAGSFDVVLDDGKNSPRRFTLNRPYQGLYIPTGIWRTLENFSGGAVSTVLTSHPYSEPDYVREYSTFKHLTNSK